ncbi:hypothetical protein L218DRAFT_886561 [Marasmius fiardii PR-910]|nr:hypothetical protein L218DRAFT_886561 [Marasmius fiardii PR-910]
MDPYESKWRSIWFTQAHYIFATLNIPQDDWEDYGRVNEISLALSVPTTQERSSSSSDDHLLYHLFVHPFSRLSNGLPDVPSWTSGTGLYYWSTDPDGHSAMTEEKCVTQALPSYVPKVLFSRSLEDYDFMQDFQEAKGFDPTTMDYRCSLGLPILDVLYPGEGQFEVIVDDTGLFAFPHEKSCI